MAVPALSEVNRNLFNTLIDHHIRFTLAKRRVELAKSDWYRVTALVVRDMLVEKMLATRVRFERADAKKLYYLSLEFLIGRSLENNLFNLGLILWFVLVDYARQRNAQRRGDGAARLSIHDTQVAIEADNAQGLDAFHDDRVDVVAIDSALTRLEQIDAPQSRIVELRYFGGLTLEETASVVGVSLATVKREWSMARAWLRRELTAA